MTPESKRRWAIGLGLGGGGLALGAAAYFVSRYLRGRALSTTVSGLAVTAAPSSLAASGSQAVAITANWTNGTKGPLTYLVQAAVIEESAVTAGIAAGVVGGHAYITSALAEQASSLFATGEPAAAAFAAVPGNRLVAVTAQPGQASATLYCLIDPASVVPPLAVAAWVEPAPWFSGTFPRLLVSDPVGTQLSGLQVTGLDEQVLGLAVA